MHHLSDTKHPHSFLADMPTCLIGNICILSKHANMLASLMGVWHRILVGLAEIRIVVHAGIYRGGSEWGHLVARHAPQCRAGVHGQVHAASQYPAHSRA